MAEGPDFDREYRKAKRTAFGQGRIPATTGNGRSGAVMIQLMTDTAIPVSTRLRAADCVFSHAKSAIEVEEIEARVAALEHAAAVSAPTAMVLPRRTKCADFHPVAAADVEP